jgi:DNA-binding response OmpR family regulator
MNPEVSILVVDDDFVLCELLRESFAMNNYACKTALSGDAALELLNGEKFDFMVTDVVMPGMSGFALTKYVREHHPGTEIIMMTGFSHEDSCQKALAAGATDFIIKPFSIEELLARIERVRQNAHTLEEIRKREHAIEHAIVDMSREMITSIQEDAETTRKALEQEIARLKKTLS